MLINKTTGELLLPGIGTYGPTTTWVDFLASDVSGHSSRARGFVSDHVLKIPTCVYNGVRLRVILAFGELVLTGASWIPVLGPEDQTWNDWSLEKQTNEMNLARAILEEDLGSPMSVEDQRPPERRRPTGDVTELIIRYEFDWGTVRQQSDFKSGNYNVSMSYADAGP